MSAIRVLIVEADFGEAGFLEEAVLEIAEIAPLGNWHGMQVFLASDLSEAIAQIQGEELDIVLLNPNLIGAVGLDTFRKLKAYAPDLPFILIVDDPEELDMARKALREGAQDYLLRSELDCKPLAHSIEAAIERSRLTRALWNAFQFDEFTGMPNRSGFVYLAELVRTLLGRLDEPMRLIIAEVDGVSRGLPGSREMDVLEAADALRTCLDPGDVIGRVASRHFCVLSPALTSNALKDRIEHASPPGHKVKFRWSELETSATSETPVEQLLQSAEQVLCETNALAFSAVH
ncbi:MAG TPA: response regulator [Bryobacteraceae bacterium]|jgi:PleD family two-component response regulator